MINQLDIELAARVLDWIKDRAFKHGVDVTVYEEGVVRDGNWLHVPVTIHRDGDAYDRARLLQAIEDEWEPNAFGGIQLLLVPTKASEPTKLDWYTQFAELMQRQHVLLDRMGEDGIDDPNSERFMSIRSEWASLLQEMERVYPNFKNDVP